MTTEGSNLKESNVQSYNYLPCIVCIHLFSTSKSFFVSLLCIEHGFETITNFSFSSPIFNFCTVRESLLKLRIEREIIENFFLQKYNIMRMNRQRPT